MERPTTDPWRDRGYYASNDDTALDQRKRIGTKDIFRELIADEVRSGKLTNSRRKRIVRYAAQLDLTAVETGRLIERCRQECALDAGPLRPTRSLRIVASKKSRLPDWVKIWMVVVLALAADWTLFRWLW